MCKTVSRKTVVIMMGLLGCVALILGGLVSYHLYEKKRPDLSQFQGTLLNQPRTVAPFMLTGIDGQPFDNASLQGQWTLLFFGFTHCRSVCPRTMAELAQMVHRLKEQKVTPLPRVVIISIDPARDDIPTLAAFAKAFNPDFYGARGEETVISAMARDMGIAYATFALNTAEASSYDIEHTGTLMLFNPEGELSAFFTSPHRAEQLALDYSLLIH